MANIYNEAGATAIDFYLANQTASYIAAHLGNCRVYVETDNKYLTYTDQAGAQYWAQQRMSVAQYGVPYSSASSGWVLSASNMTYTPNDSGIDKWYSAGAYNNRFRVSSNNLGDFDTYSEIGARFLGVPSPSRSDLGGIQITAYDTGLTGADICELDKGYLTRLWAENTTAMLIDIADDDSIYFGSNDKLRARINSTSSLTLYGLNSTYSLLFQHEGSAHGVTDILPTDCRFGIITSLPETNSGGFTRLVAINSYADANPDPALKIEGIINDGGTAMIFDGAAIDDDPVTNRKALTSGYISVFKNNTTTKAYIDYAGMLCCESLRINQAPATATITPDKVIDINMNGTVYQIAVKQKP